MMLLILMLGCTGEPKVGFDADKWRLDQNGCHMDRYHIYLDIVDHRKEILGLDNRQIIKVLGKPERNELYQRNQKFFIYNISPSETCLTEYKGEHLYLIVRFNAVGLSQEIFVSDRASLRDQ